MNDTAILIGQPGTCKRLEQMLDLLPKRPVSLGWIVADTDTAAVDGPVLGTLDELEAILSRRRPEVALVSLPGCMTELIQAVRTRLRRAGVPDRFVPTIEDQLAGVGPRSRLTIDIAELLDRQPRWVDEEAVSGLLKRRRVLITGAGGSIGSELCRFVARFNPSELIMIERSENALFEIDRQVARFWPTLSRRAVLHDVVDRQGTFRLAEALQPEIIFHAAAHKHVPMMEEHPAAAVENNLLGTRNMADAAHAVGSDRFVMISTDKAVNPSSVMGATKRLAEMYVQHLALESETVFSVVRFGNVIGSSGSVLDVWDRQIAEGGPITVTDARMTRYFMTIPEAAALVVQSAALTDIPKHGADVFVLNMGEPIKILDLAQRFVEMHGLTPVVGSAAPLGAGSLRIVLTGARPGEKLFEELARDGQALRPTRHPDIDIWSLPQPEASHMQRILDRFGRNMRSLDPATVAAEIRAMVPEMVQPVAA